MKSSTELLGPDGPIAARLPGYERRPQQLQMAQAVERALVEGRHLLAEAGTGVGKSFAYLLPAVLHAVAHAGEGPVVVSTRTIALQQQLEGKDLPFLRSILPLEWNTVTAIGRNHYLCLRRMHLAARESATLFPDVERLAQLRRVVDWSATTPSGVRFELDPPVDTAVWEEVQAEHNNCLHRACPYYEPCLYQRARRRMETAQILVVNHALYMADVALRLAGAAYLPAHRVVIFDEAHHLERVASESLGLRITLGTVLWHLRRLHPERSGRSLLKAHGTPRARLLVGEIRELARSFFADLEDRLRHSDTATTAELGEEPLEDPLSDLLDELALQVLSCAEDVAALDLRTELQARARGLAGLATALRALCGPGDPDHVRWLERFKAGVELRSAPLRVADALRRAVFDAGKIAILTSATLTAGPHDDFSWLRERLGIGDADRLRVGSPFDYSRAVRLRLLTDLPDPGQDQEGFLHAACERVLELLRSHGGRALVLCTSWQFVRRLASYLRAPLEDMGIPLLVQGEAPLHRLLERKKAEPHSVLIGTDSLWEGIDVPGEALSLLVLTRFPFRNPNHPLTRARMRACERAGGDAFADHTLPEAILRFRQGFGRLVRSSADAGTVAILDPRARTKAYGRAFLEALPEGVRVSDATDA